MDELDVLVREHYAAQRAPAAVRERLVALAIDRRRLDRRVRRRWLPLLPLAAALLVIGLAVQEWRARSYAAAPEIAESVAAYHVRQKPSDIVSPRIEDVATALARLDFALRLPQRPDLPRWRLEGGRYCSLAGNIAAQLRLIDADGGVHTVYVARRAGAIAGVRDFRTEVDGVRVTIWSEDGLSFAWAAGGR